MSLDEASGLDDTRAPMTSEEAGLYAIIDPAAVRGREPDRVAAAALAGGCARLQLRWKEGPDSAVLELARRLALLCREAGVPFIMNDRADLALLSGADGLHLGQGDVSVADARSLLTDHEIGLSSHDRGQALAAQGTGADLVAFGPVWDTTSKAARDPVVGLEGLQMICATLERPVVAIGGITIENAAGVRDAGAAFGAVIGALATAEDPEAMARSLHRALGGASCSSNS